MSDRLFDEKPFRINDWKMDYNGTRPHSSLGNLTPSAFAAQLNQTRKVARSPDQKRGELQPHHELTFTTDQTDRAGQGLFGGVVDRAVGVSGRTVRSAGG